MNRDDFWLTDVQFARVDDRRVISGIVHVLKSGGRWIDDPEIYPKEEAGLFRERLRARVRLLSV